MTIVSLAERRRAVNCFIAILYWIGRSNSLILFADVAACFFLIWCLGLNISTVHPVRRKSGHRTSSPSTGVLSVPNEQRIRSSGEGVDFFQVLVHVFKFAVTNWAPVLKSRRKVRHVYRDSPGFCWIHLVPAGCGICRLDIHLKVTCG